MATEWVEMVHDATGGRGHVPNKSNVIESRRAKGWRLASDPKSAPKLKRNPVVKDGDDANEEQEHG